MVPESELKVCIYWWNPARREGFRGWFPTLTMAMAWAKASPLRGLLWIEAKDAPAFRVE